MKLKLFGYEIKLTKESEKLENLGRQAKIESSLNAIKSALDTIENKGLKYSEYRVQQLSGVSINTVKKYRTEIEEYRSTIARSLF